MCEKGELGIVPKWEEDKWVGNYFYYLCQHWAATWIENSEEKVPVPFPSLGIPRRSSLHACGFLGLQKEWPKTL